MHNTQREAQCNSTRLLENALQVNMEKEFLLQVRAGKKVSKKYISTPNVETRIFTSILNK